MRKTLRPWVRGVLTGTLAFTFASTASAKPWNGIEPGLTPKAEVLKKFGTPTRVVATDGKEVLAYLEKDAIKGTTQTQFRVDPTSSLVERIDVFPGPVVDKDAIENTYGPMCGSNAPAAAPCYVKKVTDEFRTYYLYAKLGVAIFFNEDGRTVHSFIFQAVKGAGSQPSKDAPKETVKAAE